MICGIKVSYTCDATKSFGECYKRKTAWALYSSIEEESTFNSTCLVCRRLIDCAVAAARGACQHPAANHRPGRPVEEPLQRHDQSPARNCMDRCRVVPGAYPEVQLPLCPPWSALSQVVLPQMDAFMFLSWHSPCCGLVEHDLLNMYPTGIPDLLYTQSIVANDTANH